MSWFGTRWDGAQSTGSGRLERGGCADFHILLLTSTSDLNMRQETMRRQEGCTYWKLVVRTFMGRRGGRTEPRTVSVDRQLPELSMDAWRSPFFVIVTPKQAEGVAVGASQRGPAGGVACLERCEARMKGRWVGRAAGNQGELRRLHY